MGFLDFLGDAVNAIVPGVQTGIAVANYQEQKRQNAWERQQYVENRDYQRALQERVFAREDSALQRGVLDAKRSGLSPLAATGSSSGSVVSMSSAPSQQAPELQLDAIALAQAMENIQSSKSARKLADRQQKHVEKVHEDNKRLTEEAQAEQKRHNEAMEKGSSESLAENKRQFNETMESNKSNFDREFGLKMFQAMANNAREDLKISMEKELHEERITQEQYNTNIKMFEMLEKYVSAYYAEEITLTELQEKALNVAQKEIDVFESGQYKRYVDRWRELGPVGETIADTLEGVMGLGGEVFGTLGSVFNGK